MRLRRIFQFLSLSMLNSWWMFFITKSIYQGPLKAICVPVLNCYSCPAAIGACPIGALQVLIAGIRPAISTGHYYFGLYIIGTLGIIGSLTGRMVCGWLCPFGFLQEILYKIPCPKFEIPRGLSYLKYLILIFFVIIFPVMIVDEFGYGSPWFCKYICPAGTLEAGIPMLFLQPELKELIGLLFYSKLAILILFLIGMACTKRPFCKIACPLGAIYSLFNKFSMLKMYHHPDKCKNCHTCYSNCPMGIRFYENPNHIDCIRCLKCMKESCQYGAISCQF